jgi:hypothetical protein
MKNIYTVTLLLLASFCGARAQVTLSFTIPQYAQLTVQAGSDSTVKSGAVIRLGSATPASGSYNATVELITLAESYGSSGNILSTHTFTGTLSY